MIHMTNETQILLAGDAIDYQIDDKKIKLAVLNRKNAGFFKSAVGANVGDALTSIMATAAAAGVNIFDYLNALQRNRARVKLNPEQCLPWCYEASLARWRGKVAWCGDVGCCHAMVP